MLSGVTVSCFVFSYLVVMCMEAARVFLKIPGRNTLLVVMLVAGLFAHSVFILNEFWIAESSSLKLLANWFQWSVVAAWCLAVAYLILVLRNPTSAAGLFLIPLILALIGVGLSLRDSTPFGSSPNNNLWSVIHGVSLLLGTMFICFGMAFGAMYLLQSFRLKSRTGKRRKKLKLPPLEFLQSMNRLSLVATTVALAVGLLSGVALNFQKDGNQAWLSTSVLVSLALFLWTLGVTWLELSGKGSLGGRRSAYLVVANFVFMLVVLGVVMLSGHGRQEAGKEPAASGSQRAAVLVTLNSNIGRKES